MSKHSDSGRISAAASTNRTKRATCSQARRLRFESLEHRRLLTALSLGSISTVTVPAGGSALVALNGSQSGLNFGVTSSDPTQVTPSLMPQTNKSVTFNIDGSGIVGAMTFQLFDNLTPSIASQIETLVTDKIYNGDSIYRSAAGFVVQGGNDLPTISGGKVTGQTTVNTVPSGVPTSVNDEFNPDLTYTSAGSLGFAIPSPNGGSTEFFVGEGTSTAQSSLNYSYSLFGFQTVNQAISVNGVSTTVLGALEADSTSADVVASSGGDPLTPIQISSATLSTDTQNGVLMLRAPSTASGSYTVTVTAYDGTDTPATQTFKVNVESNTSGSVANPWASKTPTTPTGIKFMPASGQGAAFTSANNSSPSTELEFQVSGVTVGDTVTLYADGVAIGSVANATLTEQPIFTNGSTALLDGMHTFAATVTAPNVSTTWTDSQSNSRTDTANVDSYSSPGVQVQVITKLVVTASPSTSAKVGQVYTYVVQTNAPSSDAITVTASTVPTGMQLTGADTFTWTPTSSQVDTAPAFSATIRDALGFTATIGPVDISVALGVPVTSIPANASKGGNVTVKFIGNQVLVYDAIGNDALTYTSFTSTDSVEIDCPAGQANTVWVVVPASGSPLPQQVLIQGASGSTNNQVIMYGTNGANTFTLNGGTVTSNGLSTQVTNVQKLTLAGFGGNDDYTLDSSSEPTRVVDTGGNNTMDFSHDTAGVDVNLGLDKGQAQSIAPWNTTLSIYGVINKLIGSAHADVLTGGPAATTEIVAGAGNDTITGGSGDNILLGGGGSDTITGGLGRNLMIGGAGNCNFYAKGSESTVFAGTTNIDNNDQALLDLLDQGSRANYGYSARRLLASAAQSPALLSSPAVSFHDTGATDTIHGNNINNWFVLGANGKVVS